MMPQSNYDVVIVGAGVAGSALAHAFSITSRQTPLRIALLERSLAEPDRIVGELLQPGGFIALKKLGLESCVDGIDAIPVYGYCVFENGKVVHIPYPGRHEGRTFHHGRFIMNLRAAAKKAVGVDVVEATVTDLIECESTGRVKGVRATRKDVGVESEKWEYHAKLVVIADGCFSNFRTTVMGEASAKSTTKSYFLGAVLENARLPIPKHGTVALLRDSGPVLLYQISEHDTRMLADVKAPLPSDLKGHILSHIAPQLPPGVHEPVRLAVEKDRIRRMPNSFLPPVQQGSAGSKEGAVLIGDSWNMRHPLTGGGITVALHDVVIFSSLVGSIPDLSDWDQIKQVLYQWHWTRKPLASTVNILSVALYDLFSANDEQLAVLRLGCFKYFERGGECIDGPISLLSGIAPSPVLLAYHFFSVALYSIWIMFTHPSPSPISSAPNGVHPVQAKPPPFWNYPALFVKSIRVIWTACVVFCPLLWSEIRWWSPDDTKGRNVVVMKTVIPVTLVAIGVTLVLNLPSRS